MRRVGDLLLDLLTIVAVLFMLMSIVWVFLASLKPDSQIMAGNLWPTDITLEHYRQILARRDFLIALRNSLIVATLVAIITTLLAVPAAYALSRFTFRGRGPLSLLILATQMLPVVAILVPLVVIMRSLGLINTLTALVITHLALGLPVAVWLLKGYVDAIPRELEEAAMIDGCGRFGALRFVLFPLLRPAIVAAGTFAFVLSWGEFLLALALISKTEVKTLPLALQAVFDPYSFSWGEVMAGGVVIAAPAIILFFLFRSQLVGGLTAGGVKG
jgi:ABC-type glycerol-3-phosphate transport system permease component